MAFFSVDDSTTRSMWPKALVGEDNGSIAEKWRLLPVQSEALEQRISVDGAQSMSPKLLLTHPELDERGELKEMVIRLQGVVGEVNVKVLGNWSENEDHAPKAVQFLTLVGVAQEPAFALQREGVLHLEELVMTSLGEQFLGDVVRNGAINLRRRVFERVREENEGKSINLTAREDPGAKARKMNGRWIVDHRIKVGVQDETGRVIVSTPLSIHRGDFVDVAVKVQVVRIRGRYSRRTEVMFSPTELVRLRSASEVNAYMRPQRQVSVPKAVTVPKVGDLTSGFTFRDSAVGLGDGEHMDQD